MSRYYKIRQSLNETTCWLYLLKYFFEIILKKPSLDSKCCENESFKMSNLKIITSNQTENMILLIWKQFGDLLKLSAASDEMEISVHQNEQVREEMDEYAHMDLSQLVETFLRCSIEYINNHQVSNKQHENVSVYKQQNNTKNIYILIIF